MVFIFNAGIATRQIDFGSSQKMDLATHSFKIPIPAITWLSATRALFLILAKMKIVYGLCPNEDHTYTIFILIADFITLQKQSCVGVN